MNQTTGPGWDQPTSENKPWTRWWWLGSAVSRENVADLLQRYARAGLGGVEITPIYGVRGDEASEIPYLSPEWVGMLEFTIREARRLGMGVDMPTGTGWPFGGPHVRDEDALDKLALERAEVRPEETIRLDGHGRLLAATAYRSDGHVLPLDDAGSRTEWQAPPGLPWRLYTASLTWGGRDVKRAAPGGAGKCINPFSQESLRRYLTRFDEALGGLESGALRCHFHDSFEYQADFSSDFFGTFRLRRGYDLGRHLDALLGDIEDEDRIRRVKTDYRQTVGEMLLENFTEHWTQWAHSHGSRSRNQAHGSPGNLLDLYGAPDIPETETFGGVGDPVFNKFASSAAHLAGRTLCSSETCTWLDEHFQVTLAQCKNAIDGLLVAGINHIFYHGTAYSPLTDKWPGRLFYASTTFAPQDPLWHDFPTLNAYVSRCQTILQAGRPDNDLLLYWPLPDLWMKRPDVFQLDIGGRWSDGQPFTALSRRLWGEGYQFDYVSDRQLQSLSAQGDPLGYRAVVVPPCDFLPLDTLDALCRLAEGGVPVLFIGDPPRDVPGYADLDGRRRQFAERMGQLASTAKVVGGDDLPAHLAASGVRREPLADLSGVEIIRRRSEFGHDYFVTNRGTSAIAGWEPLGSAPGPVLLMDPMTGATGLAESRTAGDHLDVNLQLAPGQSLVMRVLSGTAAPATERWKYIVPRGETVAVGGDWTITFLEGGPTLPGTVTMPTLKPWTELEADGVEEFAGTARYSVVFDSPDPAAEAWLLDLGRVADSARVVLNGEPLGTLIAGPSRLRVGGLRPQGNRLEVSVTSVAANRIRAMDRRGETWRIFHEINFVNRKYKSFDASGWDIRPAGLLGPVTLTRIEAQ